ncbi:MAG: hypothetical protein GY811_29550 [Myxococcales bacterium]|nr:hypothetical protein [Myxococcales bacterium]
MKSLCRATLLGAGLTFVLAGAASCSKAPADGDCAKLFGHLLEMEAASSTASDEDKAKHKASMDATQRGEFVERCERNIKAAQVTCSLKATTPEEIDACDNKG